MPGLSIYVLRIYIYFNVVISCCPLSLSLQCVGQQDREIKRGWRRFEQEQQLCTHIILITTHYTQTFFFYITLNDDSDMISLCSEYVYSIDREGGEVYWRILRLINCTKSRPAHVPHSSLPAPRVNPRPSTSNWNRCHCTLSKVYILCYKYIINCVCLFYMEVMII